MAILETRNLSKTYGRGDAAVCALRGTDLELKEGQFTAIVGPSGSGKSTLLLRVFASPGTLWWSSPTTHGWQRGRIAPSRSSRRRCEGG